MSRQKRFRSEAWKIRQKILKVCDQRNLSKEEFDRLRRKVPQKTRNLRKSVGLVRRSGASANERKKNPALFSFLPYSW